MTGPAVAISLDQRRRRALVGLCLALGLVDLAFLDGVAIPRALAGRHADNGPFSATATPRSVEHLAPPVIAQLPAAAAPIESAAEPTLVIQFDTGQAMLTSRGRAVIDGLARRLASRRAVRLSIEGHADARGESSLNQRLSRERARVVARRLEARGLDQRQLGLTAFGATRPAAEGSDEAALRRNRRVEIVILRGAP
jgi:outer membrane protein OmpA-like peptidoglycan-associated protein